MNNLFLVYKQYKKKLLKVFPNNTNNKQNSFSLKNLFTIENSAKINLKIYTTKLVFLSKTLITHDSYRSATENYYNLRRRSVESAFVDEEVSKMNRSSYALTEVRNENY